jgi:hypothetical protein
VPVQHRGDVRLARLLEDLGLRRVGVKGVVEGVLVGRPLLAPEVPPRDPRFRDDDDLNHAVVQHGWVGPAVEPQTGQRIDCRLVYTLFLMTLQHFCAPCSLSLGDRGRIRTATTMLLEWAAGALATSMLAPPPPPPSMARLLSLRWPLWDGGMIR